MRRSPYFLTMRYPTHFKLAKDKPDFIHNRTSDWTFRVSTPHEQHPLEVAAQLVMEVNNLFLQGAGNEKRD